jgi:hypothetical protein
MSVNYAENLGLAVVFALIIEVIPFFLNRQFLEAFLITYKVWALPLWWELSLLTILLFVIISYCDLSKAIVKILNKLGIGN